MAKVKVGHTRLYRGDSTAIEDFSLEKANPGALFGKGIYLTSSERVARDYTAKNATEGDVIFSQKYPPKTTNKLAVASAIESYIWQNFLDKSPFSDGKEFCYIHKLQPEPKDIKYIPEYDARWEIAKRKWLEVEPTIDVLRKIDGWVVFRKNIMVVKFLHLRYPMKYWKNVYQQMNGGFICTLLQKFVF